jgi:hypothetical protein
MAYVDGLELFAKSKEGTEGAIDIVSQFNILFNIATTTILEVVWFGYIYVSSI